MIQTIQGGVGQATKSILSSLDEVNPSAEIADQAETALSDIMVATTDNEQKIRSIEQSATTMQGFSESVHTAIEMNQEVSDLNRMAQLQFDMSQAQEDLISHFTLEEYQRP